MQLRLQNDTRRQRHLICRLYEKVQALGHVNRRQAIAAKAAIAEAGTGQRAKIADVARPDIEVCFRIRVSKIIRFGAGSAGSKERVNQHRNHKVEVEVPSSKHVKVISHKREGAAVTSRPVQCGSGRAGRCATHIRSRRFTVIART